MILQWGRIFQKILIVQVLMKSVFSGDHLDLNYSLLQETGKNCSDRDSCVTFGRSNRGPQGIETDWKRRNCFCDDQCAMFSDCCIDAPVYKQSEQRQKMFDCSTFKQYGSLYVRSQCRSDWEDEIIKSACQNPDVLKDPFGSMPVTNDETGITYSNYFCAVCNGDEGDLQFWDPRLECPTLSGYSSRFHNISSAFIAKHLNFDVERQQWGVSVDTSGVAVFHECYIDPSMPNTLADRIRPCSGKETVSECSDDFSDEEVRQLCDSYTAIVYEAGTTYRNVHCAMCNNVDLSKLRCYNLGPFGRVNWQQNFNTFSFAVLFHIGGDDDQAVGYEKSPCDVGELYDPFFKKCRNVVCGKDSKVFRNGRCVDIDNDLELEFTTRRPEEEPEDTTLVQDKNELDTPLPTEFLTDGPETEPSVPEKEQVTDSQLESSFAKCPKFELDTGEFEILNSTHVYIDKYRKTVGSRDFRLKNNDQSLEICAWIAEATDEIRKFGPEMSYVTLGCVGVSIICLILHLSATFISPDLQNLSGKNLFSLSVSLLGSYVTFLSAMFRGRDEELEEDNGCFTLAVFMYFFFMASFFWMLIIAFDVCRTLRLATTQLRLSGGSQWKKFILYSLFAWILPLTFTVITVVVDRLKDVIPDDYRPGFGEHSLCWFSNKKALLVYFAVPFAGVMGFNIFLFIFSAYIIHESTSSGAKITSTKPKTNFHLYLRLTVIMGITWILGLAAGFINTEPLWYAFIALNTLQGLFIFVAFTCTKKVISSLKERLCSCRLKALPSSSDGTGQLSRSRLNDWSKDNNTTSTSSGSLSGKRGNVLSPTKSESLDSPDSTIPSRYGSRSKTMYTVSKYQANCASYQKSFDGRYF